MENVLLPFLQQCISVKKPDADLSQVPVYSELINNSDNFPIEFPIETIRCKLLSENIGKDVLEQNIISTYPLIHERVLILLCHFLTFKREYGTSLEKELYKDMSVIELVDRLLNKRSVSFVGAGDRYLLLSKETGMMGWKKIGTEEEKPPLILRDCISYDEIKLSAMLYVSGHTAFINNGSRTNAGVVEPLSENFEPSGVIIGLIGTRLKETKMEYEDIILTAKQNTKKNGYGSNDSFFDKITSKIINLGQKESAIGCWRAIWSDFYGEPSLTYEQALKNYKIESESEGKETKTDKHNSRYVFASDFLFDNVIYSKHLSVPFDCALLEANKRAKTKGTQAYLHVVGIGLGVWRILGHQNQEFIKIFLERIRHLSPRLVNISDVHFAYFGDIPDDVLSKEGSFIEIANHPSDGIKIHLSKRQPSSKLIGEHYGKLLVETYPWDGNALPGNEFWNGSLMSSGDPAAACSTQVAELHNSHINRRFVCGANLHVAGQHGLKHISEYAQDILSSLTQG